VGAKNVSQNTRGIIVNEMWDRLKHLDLFFVHELTLGT